jgi:nucleotide-binding universal stress UspA family protein
MYSRILVPVDGSETARLGLAEAIKLARALHACIRVIHVVDIGVLMSSEAAAVSYDMFIDGLRVGGKGLLEDAAAAVSHAGIEVDTAMLEAWDTGVGECIVQKAREYPADLIVCGTHGRRGVRRLLMGSDAEYIVRHSPVPVLLVRTPDAAKPG